jgi:hypothetical protein
VRGIFLLYLVGMSVMIHIDDKLQAESTDMVMDFLEAMVDEGYDLNDLVAAMLCCVSAIMEAEVIDEARMQ